MVARVCASPAHALGKSCVMETPTTLKNAITAKMSLGPGIRPCVPLRKSGIITAKMTSREEEKERDTSMDRK